MTTPRPRSKSAKKTSSSKAKPEMDAAERDGDSEATAAESSGQTEPKTKAAGKRSPTGGTKKAKGSSRSTTGAKAAKAVAGTKSESAAQSGGGSAKKKPAKSSKAASGSDSASAAGSEAASGTSTSGKSARAKSAKSKASAAKPSGPSASAGKGEQTTAELVAAAAKTRVPTIAPSSIQNLNVAMRWLNSLTDFERQRIVNYTPKVFDLNRMRELLAGLGDPHEKFRSVHIAGTKGKGSTCAMLAAMLQGCNYTVGLFSSPHLIHLSERITINGSAISNADLTDGLRRVATCAAKLSNGPVTFFEALTAVAFLYFAEQAVDVAVIETGLGGRLDSTNVITPLASGITAISMDHMNVLGHELGKIAREKAGIFKSDVPAISITQVPEVTKVLQEVAQEVSAPLEFTGKEIDFSYRFESTRELGPHCRVSIITPTSRYEHLAVPLQGEHQALNCGLALALLDKLKAHDFKLPEEQVVAGLASTQLAGRMEQVHQSPRVLIDGAHNSASIQALIRALGAHINYDSLVMIFGCGQDKDINGMLKQVALGADKVIFTKSRHNPRAVEPEDLLARFHDFSGKMAQVAPKLEDAIRLAGRAVSREDLIVITGSFYIAGEARKLFLDAAKTRRR